MISNNMLTIIRAMPGGLMVEPNLPPELLDWLKPSISLPSAPANLAN